MQRCDKKPTATHLLSELSKLKTQQKYLEATQVTLKPISHTASEANELNELECLKIEQDLNTAALTDKIKHDTFRLKDTVQNFCNEMLNETSLCKFNTKQYREKIEVIDQQQRELDAKNLEQFKKLKIDYCNIESELMALMQNLDLLEKMPTIKNRVNATMNIRRVQSAPIDRSDLDDVRRFDRYLKEHNGHTGGWIQEEHLLFVKLKNKHNNNIEQMCSAFHAFLVDKSEEEIRAHNDWHEKYLELKLKNREAIQNWRRNRTTPLRTMLQTA